MPPKFKYNWQEIEAWHAANGATNRRTARHFGMPLSTVREHFKLKRRKLARAASAPAAPAPAAPAPEPQQDIISLDIPVDVLAEILALCLGQDKLYRVGNTLASFIGDTRSGHRRILQTMTTEHFPAWAEAWLPFLGEIPGFRSVHTKKLAARILASPRFRKHLLALSLND